MTTGPKPQDPKQETPNRAAVEDDALLRDALVSLERSRQKETRARAAAETLVTAMHRLVQAASVEEITQGVLSAFAEVARARDVVVLVQETPDAEFRAVAQTLPGAPVVIRKTEGPFVRAVSGRSVLIGEIAKAPAWAHVDGVATDMTQSALLIPMPIKDSRALLMGLHPDRNRFNRADLTAALAFAPVAAEAYLRARQIEAIDRLVTRLDIMANHDALTGLSNRQRFLDQLEKIDAAPPSERERYALLHLDLDGFKAINDSLGHAAGDAILKEAACRLRAAARPGELVARLGGDEFVLKLRLDDPSEDPTERARALLETITKPVHFEGQALGVGASIGLAISPDDAHDSAGALRASDVALVIAKTSGRGRVARFCNDMNRKLYRRRQIESELQTAITRREFTLHYQPLYSSETNCVSGFEALIRWNNARIGPIAPPEFLGIAADCGLMPGIGEWVTRRACEEIGPWLREKAGRRLSVNVASAQLVAPNFVEEMSAIAAEFDIEPSMLELELSEEIVIQRTAETALDNLMDLHAAGFQIAFDDFGTGYSSLQHLRRFPGQRLKIDRSFIMHIDTRPDDLRLVRGLADLAGALNLAVVAEGVETPEQLRCAIEAGCDEIQGYVLARPQPVSDALGGIEAVEAMAAEILSDDGEDLLSSHAS